MLTHIKFMEERSFWCCLEEAEAHLYSGWAENFDLSMLIVYYKLFYLAFELIVPIHRLNYYYNFCII